MPQNKILIVDDDPDLQRALRLRLRASKYDTVHAEDGYAAIAVAREEHPDLIVLDLGLPAGDGFTVLDNLQKIDSLSARDPHQNRERAIKGGAVAFFQKPVDNAELLDTISNELANFRPAVPGPS
jgi:DNA-binding response OmpR family regulator